MSLVSKEKDDENAGRQIYHDNSVVRDLANCMEHPEFRGFIDKYFVDANSTRTIVLLLKLYQYIDIQYPGATPFEKIALFDKAMGTADTRKKIMGEFIDWMNDDHHSLTLRDA